MSVRRPPLKALRAFDAAARLGSFLLAADELHVTPSAVSYQIILTKADTVKPGPLAAVRDMIAKELVEHVAAHPEILLTSASDGFGVPEVRAALSELALPA